jgi:hypothetical protein
MSSFYQGNDPDVDYSGAGEAVALAQAWAIKLDGPVEGDNYSSAYNANLAQDSATASAASAGQSAASAAEAAESADKLDSLLLGDLVDVSNMAPADLAVLTWNANNQMWEPSVVVPAGASQALLDKILAFEQKLVQYGVIPA